MKKDTVIRARVSKAESETIKKKAAQLGMTISEYIRCSCLNRRIKGSVEQPRRGGAETA